VSALLAVVERAVGRAIQNLVQDHPEALQGHVAAARRSGLIGMLTAELLLAMGHQPPVKLRAPGERYSPSPAARRMQRLQSRARTGVALESPAMTATPSAPTVPQHPSQADRHGKGDSDNLGYERPALLAHQRALARQAVREDLAAARAARQASQNDQDA